MLNTKKTENMKQANDIVWIVKTTEGVSQGFHVGTQGYDADILFWNTEEAANKHAANSYREAVAVKVTWSMYRYLNS
tara:strand:+ start:2928 stop:3158 length:231 start_codon:yes stop_codon:yes gene_type:complete